MNKYFRRMMVHNLTNTRLHAWLGMSLEAAPSFAERREVQSKNRPCIIKPRQAKKPNVFWEEARSSEWSSLPSALSIAHCIDVICGNTSFNLHCWECSPKRNHTFFFILFLLDFCSMLNFIMVQCAAFRAHSASTAWWQWPLNRMAGHPPHFVQRYFAWGRRRTDWRRTRCMGWHTASVRPEVTMSGGNQKAIRHSCKGTAARIWEAPPRGR